ncbi:ParB/RepB/Spo0J family partition protein [Mycobacterium sp. NPDC003323]
MTETPTARMPRRPAKAAGKRKTANRFAQFAGGDAADIHSPAAGDGSPDDSGLIGGMSAIAADSAHRVLQLPVNEIAPHPFNAAQRSQPQPDDPKWEELLASVRANGVRLPLLAVGREAFVAARPEAGSSIDAGYRYVLIYGHRRRIAALEAGRQSVPVVVDDAILADNGDLDAMATENLGREDLPALAEAELFARYSDLGLSQRAIAERLGVNQATVSRRLALLLLAPEVRKAVETGRLPSAEAAILSGMLPYGPPRRWQKGTDPDQGSDRRRDEQVEAQRLVVQHNWTASRAAERVIAERESRAEAHGLGVVLVEDPRAELGEHYIDHRISRDEYRPGADVVGAINSGTGYLDLYVRALASPDQSPPLSDDDGDSDDGGLGPVNGHTPTESAPPREDPARTASDPPPAAAGDDPQEEPVAVDPEAARRAEDAAAAAAAQAHRRQACSTLIGLAPTNAELLKTLVRQYLSGVAVRCQTSAVRALLRDWDSHVEGNSDKARSTMAWHRAVAADELHTAELKDKMWDDDAVSHVERLIDRVGYQPTEWERRQLDAARP